MTIGERIKKRRLEMGLTQKDIYIKTGISTGNLSRIESGGVLPSASTLIAFSEILNCSTDWILTGKEFENQIITYTSSEERVLNLYKQLPDEEQEEIISILEIKIRKLKGAKKKLEKLSNSNQKEIS